MQRFGHIYNSMVDFVWGIDAIRNFRLLEISLWDRAVYEVGWRSSLFSKSRKHSDQCFWTSLGGWKIIFFDVQAWTMPIFDYAMDPKCLFFFWKAHLWGLHFHRWAHGSKGKKCETQFYLSEFLGGGITCRLVSHSSILETQSAHFSTLEMGSKSVGVKVPLNSLNQGLFFFTLRTSLSSPWII